MRFFNFSFAAIIWTALISSAAVAKSTASPPAKPAAKPAVKQTVPNPPAAEEPATDFSAPPSAPFAFTNNRSTSVSDFRLLTQTHQLSSDALDTYLATEGIDSVRNIQGLALEFTDSIFRGILYPGYRSGARMAFHQSNIKAVDGTNHFARVTYWNMMYVLGYYLVDRDFFRWDMNGAFGLGWASIEADVGTRLSRYHASPLELAVPARVSTSMSFGYSPIFLVVELGYEWGRIGHFSSQTDKGLREPDNLRLDGMVIGVGLAYNERVSR